MQTVLVVDDEAAIAEAVRARLASEGYRVVVASDGPGALEAAEEHPPDLVVLDLMLPGMDGLEVCRRLQAARAVPVLMLTARSGEEDTVAGFEAGADDYLTKPFSARELIARIQAVLRRSAPSGESERVDAEGLSLDQAGHRVTADGRNVPLGPTEYRLLAHLMTHPDRVFTRGQLLDRVWGGNVYVEERTVDVHIRRLRKSLEPSGYDRFVQTVRGAGYRFSTQPD